MRTRILCMVVAVAMGWGCLWFVLNYHALGTARSAFESGDSDTVAELARRGDPSAQCYMGIMCEEGQARARNYSDAASWFLKAALQGNAPARRHLGLCYLNGRGVPRDEGQAVHWLTLAAEQGDVPAQLQMGRLCSGSDWRGAARWYTAAADRGNAEAQYEAALLYHEGKGVARDEIRSQVYVILSAAAGYAPAVRDRLALYEASGLSRDQALKAMEMARDWKPVASNRAL